MPSVDTTFLVLAVCMVITGSINTISAKFPDVTNSKGINGEESHFNHPFFQAATMFLGEFLCMIAFRVLVCYKSVNKQEMEKSNFNPLIFVLPACCDMTATSMMYLGLTWTYASVFQMLRGAVVIFTGIFSIIFLKRKLYGFHWLGMWLVLIGLALVGVASVIGGGSSSDAEHPLAGDILVIAAQLIAATQMVVEEKFISKYSVPPLQVVGWEGFFGLIILSTLLVPMYHIPGPHGAAHLENALDAFVQIKNSWVIALALSINICSIAFFNFFGISITKYASATTRMVLDSIRTIVIWGFSLAYGWEEFQFLQLIGFALLLSGTCIYNEVLVLPIRILGNEENKIRKMQERQERNSEIAPLLPPGGTTPKSSSVQQYP